MSTGGPATTSGDTTAQPEPIGTTSTSTTTASTTTTSTTIGDTTDDPVSTGAIDQTTGEASTCGDGILDPGEECDDGNVLAGDGCLPDCTPGTGESLPPIPLPDEGVWPRSLTTIDSALLGEPFHALVLGGDSWANYPPTGARMRRSSLPDGVLAWNFEYTISPTERRLCCVATAANGDILVAGGVANADPMLLGRLWLARVSPSGALVWTREYDLLGASPADIAIAPSGDIVLVGGVTGQAPDYEPFEVRVFDSDGEFKWLQAAPAGPGWRAWYTGVAVDVDGTIYTSGYRRPADDSFLHLEVGALTDAGVPLWHIVEPAPTHDFIGPSTIAITSEGSLAVALTETDTQWAGGELGLVSLHTDGGVSWWKTSPPTPFWDPFGGRIVAAPSGGVLVAWGEAQEDTSHTRVMRFNAAGDVMWELVSTSDWHPYDATLGPDGLLYVLEGDEVRPYLP